MKRFMKNVTKKSVSRLFVSVLFVASLFFGLPYVTKAATNSRGLEGITYTSRAGWGADESWKYEARPEYQAILASMAAQAVKNLPETEAQRKNRIAGEFVMKNYASFFTINNIIRNENGESLWWNFQYTSKKNKIVVHHTATTTALPTTLEEEKAYMQSVYKYHAFSRGRGDIGYNFVIMPSGRIYEGRAGGAGVIGAHATWNNTDSVGISLVGNFQGENNPTQGQLSSLVKLSASLMKKYSINPYDMTNYFKSSDTYPYVAVMKNYTFASHRDAGTTACPGENLYGLLSNLRKQISQEIANIPTSSLLNQNPSSPVVSSGTNSSPQPSRSNNIVPLLPIPEDDYMGSAPVKNTSIVDSTLNVLRSNYFDTHSFTPSASRILRLSGAATVNDIQRVQAGLVRVLLYEASQQKSWDVTCSPSCVVRFNGISQITKTFSVTAQSGAFVLTLSTKTVKTKIIGVNSYNSATSSGIISIDNYNRVASNGIALNTFRQGMLFMYGPTKDLQGNISTQPQLINIISLDNYLRGIAEASDKEVQAKADLLALLTKAYAMYYMGGSIKHPSIPANATYNAIDDPRFFQKYLGYGWERVSTKRPVALVNTKNQYLVYNNKLPILPYFHCSAGFTLSAQEKRGWQDTPYLQSIKDAVGVCDNNEFEGHGVGLSGKGAATMLANSATVEKVITTYYPGVSILRK